VSEEAAVHQNGQGEAETEAALPVGPAEYRSTAFLFLIFVATMGLALLFARPFVAAGVQAFEDSSDVGNSLIYIAFILAFTFLLLWIARLGKTKVIQAIVLTAVGFTLLYVFLPLLAITFGLDQVWAAPGGLPLGPALLIGLVAAAGSVVWLYKNPEWYVVDVVGFLVAAGASALFGISLDPLPIVVLLVLLAVYDAIAVYKTKHMLSLADSVIELRLPVLLVIPKHRGYSFLEEASEFRKASKENRGEREAMFMGLGDLVMPTMLVVAASHYGGTQGWGADPVLGTAVGTMVGFLALMGFVLKGNPQAGLPLLNGGAIAGFLVGLFTATGSLVFW